MNMRIAGGWLLALWLFPAAATAQEFTADELEESLENFLKEKNDANAMGALGVIASAYAGFEEGDQKQLVKVIEKCLSQRREEGDDELYLAALKTFESMGELGEKSLLKLLKHNNVKKRRKVLGQAILSIGVHHNVRSINSLTEFLVNSDAYVVACAGEALGAYHEEDEKVRKDIVEELVKTYANADALAQSRPKEPVFRDNLNAISKQMEASLAKLTGQAISGAVEWQKWYNNNKKKPWSDDQG